MKYAYFPGCSAESTARDLYLSTVAVARALGIEFEEPEAWSCCGTTMAHQVDHDLSLSLAAANLLKVKDMGLDMVVSCASCYSRMKIANHEISTNPEKREIISAALGRDYDGSVKVRHFVEIVIEDIGLDTFKKALTHTLGGLKVASYYGCLMVRPPEVAGLDDPENPVYMDRLIDAMGGVGLDWPHKVECCGGSLTLTRSDLVVKLSESIIAMAKDSGAQCMAAACPMCQINLDMRQNDILKTTGHCYNMPVIYITQLMGLCLGMSEKELGLNKLIISPKTALNFIRSSMKVLNHGKS
jgi:heterodisulfide reductase subunit B2